MKKSLKYFIPKFIVFSILLSALNCHKDQEIEMENPKSKESFNSPSIDRAQEFFNANTTQSSGLASRVSSGSFTDWEVSKTKKYKQTEDLDVDILYTPIYINTQRTDVKAFLASTENDGIVDARKLYILYKTNDISNGLSAYIVIFRLDGQMESIYNYENGIQIPFPEAASNTANRPGEAEGTDCDADISSLTLTEPQFEEWLNNCSGIPLDEVVLYSPTTSDTPFGGNSPVFDGPSWVPINLPPANPFNDDGSGTVTGNSGGAWYVPNMVSAHPLSVAIALGVPSSSEIAAWLAQQMQSNQAALEAIAAYLNANRVRSNSHNDNSSTNDGFDGQFQYQYPTISDEAVAIILAIIGFLDSGSSGAGNEIDIEDIYDIEECINNGDNNNINIEDCFEEFSSRRQCKKIKKIFQDYNPMYMTKVRDLKNKDGLTFETSVAVFEDNTVGEYEGVEGDSQVQTLPIAPASDYVSMAHVHNEVGDIKSYSVPSLGDLEWIAVRYRDGYINSSSFVAFLATADGTYFALTINDGTTFWEFFRYLDAGNMALNNFQRRNAAVYHAQIYQPIIEKYYEHKTNPLIKENAQGDSNNEQQLRYFMQFLDEANAGVTVFETDENFNTFTELSLDGSNVQRDDEPCQF